MTILRKLKQVIKSDNGIWVFLASAVTIQAAFVYCAANGFFFDQYYNMGRFYVLLLLAFSFTLLRLGIPGVLDLLRPMLVWRVPIRWYLFALFWLAVFAIGVLFVSNILRGESFKEIPFTFSLFGNFGLLKGIVLNSIIEEIVWVGLVLTLLQKQFSVFVSSQILAIFWFLWWVPIVLYGRSVIPDLPLSVLWFHYLGIAATCAWVYYFTKSGLVVAIMQMLTNALSLIVPILPHLSDFNTYLAFIFGKFIFAILLFGFFGPKPLFRKPLESTTVT
ncbi:MAG: CPBP family glutamic-type intramembrane protease [Sneathiella sp.]|uniref:CPBP family glutamic-type intramembrane protease n=1 Tax=Sneathiella sp. TaxID=1964365 RepID=UPI003001664D